MKNAKWKELAHSLAGGCLLLGLLAWSPVAEAEPPDCVENGPHTGTFCSQPGGYNTPVTLTWTNVNVLVGRTTTATLIGTVVD